MIVGFKTGPKNWAEGQAIVSELGARFCEVWFRIDKAAAYSDMLDWLQQQKVQVGLHHWGMTRDGYKTNLATNDEGVRQESIAQVKHTIDIGTRIKCAYVNVHPGAQLLETVDLETQTQKPVEIVVTDQTEAIQHLLAAAKELQAYAFERGVLLTIETMPAAEGYDVHRRDRSYFPGNIPLEAFGRLVTQGNYIANDITHTAAALTRQTTDAGQLWHSLVQFTRDIAPATRLLHVNTLLPPHDGRDSHDGILNEDFAKGVFPSLEQWQQLLRIFRDRDDLYVIPEPNAAMRANYVALQELVSHI